MKRDIVLLNYYFSRKLPGPDIYIKEMHNMIKLKTLLGEAGKFYKGSPYNDEPFDFRDDNSSSSIKTKPEWDAFVDKYNNMKGFETKTTLNGRTYRAEIKNLKTGLIWFVRNLNNNDWTYLGRKIENPNYPESLRDVTQLIANFEEINGI